MLLLPHRDGRGARELFYAREKYRSPPSPAAGFWPCACQVYEQTPRTTRPIEHAQSCELEILGDDVETARQPAVVVCEVLGIETVTWEGYTESDEVLGCEGLDE